MKTSTELLIERIVALEEALISVADAVKVALPHTQPQINTALVEWRNKLERIVQEAENED